ncbi:MAG TPA: sulfatase-like hydrolase/transferase, partial [Methylomirabilota bacterium]
PGLLVGAVYLVRRAGRRAGTIAETGVLALLAASLALQAVKVGVGSWTLAVPLAAAGGVGAALAHRRFPGVRLFASLLAWAALIVVPLLFFGAPGMRSLLAPGLAAGPGTQRPGAAPPKPVPVVLIVFDELPVVSLMDAERRLDRVHYPHLASLADAGVWYRNATTASDFTRWAVPAILSGRYPTPDAIPTPADHPNTLFTLLAPTHRLEVTEAVTDLCPRDLCQADETGAAETLLRMAADLWVVYEHVLATDDLRSRLPELTGNWAGLGEEGRGDTGDLGSPQPAWARRWRQARNRDKVGDARAFVEGISPDDPRPTFYFLHTLLTHHPYTMLPDGRRSLTRVPIPGRAQELWQHDAWAVAQHHQQHLLQAGVADRLVGRLVERLRAAGLYDRALVVITADHGIAFQPGQPLREFREINAAEIARVPLIVKYPAEVGTSGLVSDRRVETIDIVPTVAEVLEVALPWSADGQSLLDTTSPERQSRTLHYDYATRTRTFGPHELDLTDALARQQALFGDASTARSPAPPAFEALVGKRVDELPVVDADRRIDIHRPWEYGEMPTERDPVPFEVSGRVPRPLLREGEAHVAVAVNGVVRAVTRTWHGRGDWMATPPMEAWRPEGNELQVFLIDRREGRPRLSRVFRQRPRPPDLNLISGVASLEFGVRQHG